MGFGGGEPTLYPGFADLCRKSADKTRLAITLTTHGHGLTQRLADELRGNVHFLRVSVDGVGNTYESLRGRPFERLVAQLALVRSISAFGINVVINAETIGQLDAMAEFACEQGAAELLLLPEVPVRERHGIEALSKLKLEAWIARVPRRIRLAISDSGAGVGMPIASPCSGEHPLDRHAHVDAFGVLRSSAFAQTGVPIKESIIEALDRLRAVEVFA